MIEKLLQMPNISAPQQSSFSTKPILREEPLPLKYCLTPSL